MDWMVPITDIKITLLYLLFGIILMILLCMSLMILMILLCMSLRRVELGI
jgi:hypothetical protein